MFSLVAPPTKDNRELVSEADSTSVVYVVKQFFDGC
jgi:hypothetical protein